MNSNENPSQPPSVIPVDLPIPEPEVLRKLEPKAQAIVRAYIQETVQYSHSGPLPPAHELKAYEAASTGAAGRIIAMAEKEQEARHYCAKADVDAIGRGQIFALLAIGFITFLSGYIAYLGHPSAAATIMTATIGALGVAFVVVRKGEHSEQTQDAVPQNQPAKKKKPGKK